MSIWQPAPGEILLARKYIRFATGAATAVKGMRWFRDTERRDIQGELPGWPEGRQYSARGSGSVGAHGLLKGGLTAAGVAVVGALGALGASPGSLGNNSSRGGSRKSHDHADEVEDFPVMWAAPGTLARTLPWQLDPGRVDEKKYTTHAIVTDRRLVIVGLPVPKEPKVIEDEVLWEIPRSAISAVEPRDFKDGEDIKVFFTDGSWCRLSSSYRPTLMKSLMSPLELIPLEALPPAPQHTVRAFLAAQPPDVGTPFITRNSCGCYRIYAVPPSRTGVFGISDWPTIVAADGTEPEPWAYHPEDRDI